MRSCPTMKHCADASPSPLAAAVAIPPALTVPRQPGTGNPAGSRGSAEVACNSAPHGAGLVLIRRGGRVSSGHHEQGVYARGRC